MKTSFHIEPRSAWLKDFLALGAGLLYPFAFAPWGYFILGLLAPAMLLLALESASGKRAFWRGLLFGLASFGIGVSWVYVSIHEYGHSNVPVSVLITALLVVYLSLFPALQSCLYAKLFPKAQPIKWLLAFPCLWVVFDLLRGWLFTGFPWLYLGYSQIDSPFAGVAPFFGVYGVTFVTLVAAGLAVLLAANLDRQRLGAGFSLIALVCCSYFLYQINWANDTTDKIKVSLLQANIPQELKWQPGMAAKHLDLYHRLTAANWDSELIIWPEGAITTPLPYSLDDIKQLDAESKAHNSALLIGMPVMLNQRRQYYNAVITAGNADGHYFKQHLVPFGEYLPLETVLRGLINFFDLPMSYFVAGPRHQGSIIAQGKAQIASLICYEIAYPEQTRHQAANSNLIVTISDDSWFGHSIGPHQHLQIARMRALETGRIVLRATNTGITAMINAQGKVAGKLPQFKLGILNARVPLLHGVTPWNHFGIRGMMLLLAGALGMALVLRKRD